MLPDLLKKLCFFLILPPDGRRARGEQDEASGRPFTARRAATGTPSTDEGKPGLLSAQATEFTGGTAQAGSTCTEATGKGKPQVRG